MWLGSRCGRFLHKGFGGEEFKHRRGGAKVEPSASQMATVLDGGRPLTVILRNEGPPRRRWPGQMEAGAFRASDLCLASEIMLVRRGRDQRFFAPLKNDDEGRVANETNTF